MPLDHIYCKRTWVEANGSFATQRVWYPRSRSSSLTKMIDVVIIPTFDASGIELTGKDELGNPPLSSSMRVEFSALFGRAGFRTPETR